MKYCAVKDCYCYDKEGSEQRFFRFPKYLKRAWLWHEFCNDPSKAPSINRYVCDKHFVESDFVAPDLIELKNSAIPSVNGPSRTNLKETNDEIMAEDSPLTSQLKCIRQRNTTSSKKSKHVKCARTSPDIPNIVSEQSSNVCKHSGTVIKSYQRIDSELKLSLIESISPSLKRKASNSSDQIPLKTYKSNHRELEVELQPQIVFPDEEIVEELVEPENRNDVFKISRSCAFKNLDITLNSTLVFKSANDRFTPNMIVKPKRSKPSTLKDTNSKVNKLLTNENLSIKRLNSRKNKTNLDISKTDLVSPLTEKHPRSLQKQLDQINVVDRKKQHMYRNKVSSNKLFLPHLDVNDPKYSIAAVAESLGTFNSYVEEPVEEVDLDAGDWYRLYEPSEIHFPRLTKSQIGPIVNQLRSKLPTLNDRDRLEVSFLLSMMSVYPSAPKHIKQLLSQRLNLVYIATMFKWNTALALGLNVYKQTTNSKTLYGYENSSKNRFRKKKFPNTNVQASSNSNLDSVENDCTNISDLPFTSKDTFEKPVKRHQFAYEIIVQEKSSETKPNESLKTTKGR